jgi:hypothetical protein
MSTWLDEQKPIKNRWQPHPRQIALLHTGILVRGTRKNFSLLFRHGSQ